MFTPKLLRALNKSAVLHLGQTRKAGGEPYITHPFAVAWLVSEYNKDETVLCAALLHDVLEDIPNYTFTQLNDEFGTDVATLVQDLTEAKNPNQIQDDKSTWLERKQGYLLHLQNASQATILIAVADKLHNLWSMEQFYETSGEQMWQIFNAPPDKKLWFYEEVLKIAQNKLSLPLVSQLDQTIKHFKLIIT